ncbi:MAG: dienelactone hydrolase family protein [Proteobacteria bacterium]|nr:dienelactone hydrolase family protein [Pseudomonadota bacterium]
MKLPLGKPIFTALFVCLVLGACHRAASEEAVGRAFTYGGIARSYRVYAPSVRPSRPGLVLVLHGWKGSAAEIERRTKFRFNVLAKRDGYVVAYPDAVAGQWRSGNPAETATSDDVGFLSALIDALSKTYDIDPKRVFVTGFSNGASMTYRLACDRSDRIAAIAPVSGGLAQQRMPSCAALSHRPIPLLLIHGTADPVIPFDSGQLEGNLAYWVRRNGCSAPPRVTYLPDADPGTRGWSAMRAARRRQTSRCTRLRAAATIGPAATSRCDWSSEAPRPAISMGPRPSGPS